MTSFTQPGAPDVSRAPSAIAAAPTWRDLPDEPPYGPVLPPRTANLGQPFPSVLVEQAASITPGQIAMAVGGTLLLVALGIGAALLLLGGDDDDVAETTSISTESDRGAFDLPLPVDPVPVDPQPRPDAPQGELEPQQPDGGEQPNGGLQPTPDGGGPDAPQAPGGQPLPLPPLPPDDGPDEQGANELPRLFRLRTLPSGTAEDATTISQTTRADEVVTEQITTLTSDEGEIAVRASRAADTAERLDAQLTDEAQEVSIRGTPGWLIDGQRLLFLLPGREETLIEIDAPPAAGTEALLTIAQGLELLR